MMQTTVPKEHQALGRRARGFDRGKWDECEFHFYQFARRRGLEFVLVFVCE